MQRIVFQLFLTCLLYLKVCIHHEIQSKKVKEAHPGLQLVFDTVEAVDHNLLHLFLQNKARQLVTSF